MIHSIFSSHFFSSTTIIVVLLLLIQHHNHVQASREPTHDGLMNWFQPEQSSNVGFPVAAERAGLVFSIDSSNSVVAYFTVSGKQRWTSSLSEQVTSAVAVDESSCLVFVAGTTQMFALDLETGTVKWKKGGCKSSSCQMSVPSVYSHNIYFTTSEQKLYCFVGNTGDQLWEFDTSNAQVAVTPAVWAETVFFVTSVGIDAISFSNTSELLWSWTSPGTSTTVTTAGLVAASLALGHKKEALVDTMLIVGTNNGGETKLYGVRGSSGAAAWTAPTDNQVNMNCAVDPLPANKRIYCGDVLGNVYSFNPATGIRHWIKSYGGSLTAAPLAALEPALLTGGNPKAAGTTVYVGSGAELMAVSGSDGAQIFTYALSTSASWSHAAFVNGTVFSVERNGKYLLAISPCFAYHDLNNFQDSYSCPRSCREAYPSPSGVCPTCTSVLSSVVCGSTLGNDRGCRYCPRNAICSPPAPAIACDCDTLNENECLFSSRNAGTYGCSWCAAAGVCSYHNRCECFDFPQQSCRIATEKNQCLWCETQKVCANPHSTCKCSEWNLNKTICSKATQCQTCSSIPDICVNRNENPTCSCANITDEATCKDAAKSGNHCSWCGSAKVCNVFGGCNCERFSRALCERAVQTTCGWCPKQEICTSPTPPSGQAHCSCGTWNSADIRFCNKAAECTSCASIPDICVSKLTNPDCNCNKLDEATCKVAADSGKCEWCSSTSVCARPHECSCTYYPEWLCKITSSKACTWCPFQGLCATSPTTCECDDWNLEPAICDRAKICQTCTSVNVKKTNACVNKTHNPNCDCHLLPNKKTCVSASQASTSWCEWCDNAAACAPSPSTTAGVPACDCANLNQPGNSASWCDSIPSCNFCGGGGRNICVNKSENPSCLCNDVLLKPVCEMASSACRWDTSHQVCDTVGKSACEWYDERTCGIAQGCSWCNSKVHSALPDVNLCMNTNPSAPFPKPCSCYALNSTFCSQSNQAVCHWSQERSLCIETTNKDDACYPLPNEGVCKMAQGCKWCSNLNMCSDVGNVDCSCFNLTEAACDHAVSVSKADCVYCKTLGVCASSINSLHVSSSVCNATVLPESTCQHCAQTSKQCLWCDKIGLCASPSVNPNCECYLEFNEQVCNISEKCQWDSNRFACLNPGMSGACSEFEAKSLCQRPIWGCHFCDNLGVCADTTTNAKCTCQDLDASACSISQNSGAADKCSLCTEKGNLCSPKASCECDVWDASLCTPSKSDHQCHYCSTQNICASLPKNPTCNCWFYDQTLCDTASGTSCTWSLERQVCLNPDNRKSDACYFFNETICHQTQTSLDPCTWCSVQNPDKQHNAAAVSVCAQHSTCECWRFSQQECEVIEKESPHHLSSSPCRWCPLKKVCVPPSIPSCDCDEFDENQCKMAASSCYWCNSTSTCAKLASTSFLQIAACNCNLRRTKQLCTLPWSNCSWCESQATCANPDNRECHCWRYPENVCDETTHGTCKWCSKAKVCIDPSKQQTCLCDNLTSHESTCRASERRGGCTWCSKAEVCININQTRSCQCSSFDSHMCGLASGTCAMEPSIMVLPSDRKREYCAPLSYSTCSPVTCEAITLPDVCTAANCEIGRNGDCESTQCFTFFLPNFNSQAYFLLILGSLKDFGVLVFIGVYGDKLGRFISKFKFSFLECYHQVTNNVCCRASSPADSYSVEAAAASAAHEKSRYRSIPNRLDETVFLNDEFCRDSTAKNLYHYSFVEYVEKVRDALFEFDDISFSEKEEEEELRKIQQEVDQYYNENSKAAGVKVKKNNSSKKKEQQQQQTEGKEEEEDKKKGEEEEEKEEETFSEAEDHTEEDQEEQEEQEQEEEEETAEEKALRQKFDDLAQKRQKHDDMLTTLTDAIGFALYDSKRWVSIQDEFLPSMYVNGEEEEEDALAENNRAGSLLDPTSATSASGGGGASAGRKVVGGGDPFVSDSSQEKFDLDEEDNNSNRLNSRNNINRETRTSQGGGTTSSFADVSNPFLESSHLIGVSSLSGKTKITRNDFEKGIVHLQKRVTETIMLRATYAIYYASSRDTMKRIATAINVFPSVPQLAFYISGVLLMFSLALHSVLSSENRVEAIAGGCANSVSGGGNLSSSSSSSSTFSSLFNMFNDSDVTGSTNNNNNNNNNPNGPHRSSLSTASYMLVGWRILNSSTFATSILVFVKVIRGIFMNRSFGEAAPTLQQKIPVMAVFTNRRMQFFLVLYVLMVFPFAMCGPLYGLFVGYETWLPILLAIGILVVDFSILLFLRRRSQQHLKEQQQQQDPLHQHHHHHHHHHSQNEGGGGGGGFLSSVSSVFEGLLGSKGVEKKKNQIPLRRYSTFSASGLSGRYGRSELETVGTRSALDPDRTTSLSSPTNTSGKLSPSTPNNSVVEDSKASFMTAVSSGENKNNNNNNKKKKPSLPSSPSLGPSSSSPQPRLPTSKRSDSWVILEDPSGNQRNRYQHLQRSSLLSATAAATAASGGGYYGTGGGGGGGENDDLDDLRLFSKKRKQQKQDEEVKEKKKKKKRKKKQREQQQQQQTEEGEGENINISNDASNENDNSSDVDGDDVGEEEGGSSESTFNDATTIIAAEPTRIGSAVLVFLMTQEIVTLVVTIALQASFNYACLLHYAKDYSLQDDKSRVFSLDFKARSLKCMWLMLEGDVSAMSSVLSSWMPFL